jgi:hypothetical protein
MDVLVKTNHPQKLDCLVQSLGLGAKLLCNDHNRYVKVNDDFILRCAAKSHLVTAAIEHEKMGVVIKNLPSNVIGDWS